jgi:hypothetical protein
VSFSVREYRDFDLMAKIRETGPISSRELAGELGMDELGTHIGRRLGWMRRYEMLEKNDGGLWALTDGGQRVITARTRAAFIRELEELPEEELITIMSHVMARYQHGQQLIADMIRREFVYGTAHRR